MYEFPEAFELDDDEIDHDNPDFLVCMVAADRVKNDVTRKDLRNDLLAEANDIMESLREENDDTPENDASRTWNPTGHIGSDW